MFSTTTAPGIVLEAVADAFVAVDQKGVIGFINGRTKRLSRYNCDDLIGRAIETPTAEPLWQSRASGREECFAGRRTGFIGLGLQLSGGHRDRKQRSANIRVSHIATGNVLLGHGGA